MRHFLRDARNERDLTMREAADSVGISPGHYSMIEHGQRTPSGAVALKLSNVFKIDMSFFYMDGHLDGKKTS